MKILAICGSLRASSFNHGLLRAARDAAPEGVAVEIAVPGDIPLYNEDLKADGWPGPVAALRTRTYNADGLLFGCPEYNYSISGVLKNAVDWLSRPEIEANAATANRPRTPFVGKPCGVVGAAGGMAGSARGQLALRQSLQFTAALTMPQPEIYVSFAREKFDPSGELTDPPTRERVQAFMAAFAAWVGRFGTAPPG